MPVSLYALAALGYLAGWWLSAAPLRGRDAPVAATAWRPAHRAWWRAAVGAALVCHAAGLVLPQLDAQALRFGFGPALSAAMWISVGLIWIESFGAPLLAIEILVLPLAALSVWLPLAYPGADMSSLMGQAEEDLTPERREQLMKDARERAVKTRERSAQETIASIAKAPAR